MGRPTNRAERRGQIVAAFARVLADHGYAGATIAAVAAEAGVAPGLLHHHFDGKADLIAALLDDILSRFRRRVKHYERDREPLEAYCDGALRLDGSADVVAARCWVGIFSEALRDPTLFERVRRLLDAERREILARARGALGPDDAGAVLAFIVGALVVGAFAPRVTAGFASPALRRIVAAMAAPSPRPLTARQRP